MTRRCVSRSWLMPFVFTDKISVVSADETSVVSADKTSVVSADKTMYGPTFGATITEFYHI